MNELGARLAAERVAGVCEPRAPVTILTGSERIQLVEGHPPEDSGSNGQVVARRKRQTRTRGRLDRGLGDQIGCNRESAARVRRTCCSGSGVGAILECASERLGPHRARLAVVVGQADHTCARVARTRVPRRRRPGR
jgi:hypothetical protein